MNPKDLRRLLHSFCPALYAYAVHIYQPAILAIPVIASIWMVGEREKERKTTASAVSYLVLALLSIGAHVWAWGAAFGWWA